MARQFITVKVSENRVVVDDVITFVVALRGREHNIAGFVENIVKYYDKYKIIFAVQADDKPFNKGGLYNLAFKYCNTELIVFCDVDVRMREKIDFRGIMERVNKPFVPFDCIAQIKDSKQINCCYRLFAWGGYATFKRSMFEQCGGYTNLVHNWGYEDAIMQKRSGMVREKGIINHIYHEREAYNSKASGDLENNKKVFINDNKEVDNYNTVVGKEVMKVEDGNITWIGFTEIGNKTVVEQPDLPKTEVKVEEKKEVAAVVKPKGISIVIAAYKAEAFIEECLDSIVSQTYFTNNKYEILIGVDSCKATLDKIKEIQHKYKNLRLFWFPENQGTYVVQNSIIERTKNDVISIFDADDVMVSDYVEKCVQKLERGNYVRTRYINFYENRKEQKLGGGVCGAIIMYKQDHRELNGYWEQRIAADYDFEIRWLLSGRKIVDIAEHLIRRRVHSGNISYGTEMGMQSEYRRKIHLEIGRRKQNKLIKNKSYVVYKDMYEIVSPKSEYNIFDIKPVKKTILIVDPHTVRGPLQWNYYQKFISNSKFNIFITEEADGNIEDIMKKMKIKKVDLVFIGIYYGKFLLNSADYMRANNIKCIFDSADNQEFDKTSETHSSLIDAFIKTNLIEHIIVRYYPSQAIDNFVEQTNFDFEKIKCFHWGIEPVTNIPKKDIDICFIASISKEWKWHKKRVIIRDNLLKLSDKYNVVVSNNIHGEDYDKMLSRSKIFIVEGSMRLSMTQKYLQGATNRCLLVGERPITPTKGYDMFTEDNMVIVEDWSKINEVCESVLSNPKIIKEKSAKCKKMVDTYFNINDTVNKYETLFNLII